MAKFDITNAEIINKDLDVLKIDFTTETGRGHFEVKMYMFFPAAPAKFKLIIDMVNKSENPRTTAENIVLNDDIKAIFDVPETTEETLAALATSEANETATPEAVKPEEATATPEEETREPETDTNGTKPDHTPKETDSHTAAPTDTGTTATPSEFVMPTARKPRPPFYVATASKDPERQPHGSKCGHFTPLYKPRHIITPRIPCDALKGFITRHKGHVAPPGLYHCGSFLEEIPARNTGPPQGKQLILYNTS